MRRGKFHNIVTNGSVRIIGKLIEIEPGYNANNSGKNKNKILYSKSNKEVKCEKKTYFCEICMHRKCPNPTIYRIKVCNLFPKRKIKRVFYTKSLLKEYNNGIYLV